MSCVYICLTHVGLRYQTEIMREDFFIVMTVLLPIIIVMATMINNEAAVSPPPPSQHHPLLPLTSPHNLSVSKTSSKLPKVITSFVTINVILLLFFLTLSPNPSLR
ncbi:hypothetical protein Hdeb2414_s0005g00162401 [Helianthus debilis subsp. tardiflorus]